MASNVQNDMALIGKYKAGFTGEVPKTFSKPNAFTIKAPVKDDGARGAYGVPKASTGK